MNKNRIHTMIKTSNTETTLRFEWPQFFPLRPLFEWGIQTKNFTRMNVAFMSHWASRITFALKSDLRVKTRICVGKENKYKTKSGFLVTFTLFYILAVDNRPKFFPLTFNPSCKNRMGIYRMQMEFLLAQNFELKNAFTMCVGPT